MLLASVVAGCGADGCAAPRSSEEAPRLVIGVTSEPTTLVPLSLERAVHRELAQLVYRDLLRYDDAWAIQPDLAADLPSTATVGEEGLSVAWALGAHRWSDGRPMTASDVERTWRLERTQGEGFTNAETLQSVESIRIVGPRRFDVRWNTRYFAHALPRVHAVLAEGEASEDGPFSGPFMLSRWNRGIALELVRNPHWQGHPVELQRLWVRFYGSDEALEAAVLAGEVNALLEGSLGPERVRKLATRLPNLEMRSSAGSVLLHLDPRHDHPFLGRADVRRALSRLIDRAELADLVYGPAGAPTEALFPERHAGWTAPPATKGDLDELWPPPRSPITLQYGAGSAAAERAATYIQANLVRAGVPVQIQALPLGVLFERMRSGAHGELTLFGWRLHPRWDGASVLRSTGRQNWTGYSDPLMDQRVDALEVSVGSEAWARAARAVHARFHETLPIIPLVLRRSATLAPKGIEGWRPTGTVSGVTWNAEHWRLPSSVDATERSP